MTIQELCGTRVAVEIAGEQGELQCVKIAGHASELRDRAQQKLVRTPNSHRFEFTFATDGHRGS